MHLVAIFFEQLVSRDSLLLWRYNKADEPREKVKDCWSWKKKKQKKRKACFFPRLGANLLSYWDQSFFAPPIFFFRAPVHLVLGPPTPHRARAHTHTHTQTRTHTHSRDFIRNLFHRRSLWKKSYYIHFQNFYYLSII